MSRASTKAVIFLLSVNFVFTAGTYAALTAGSPGWTSGFKTLVFCSAAGALAAVSASQITASREGEGGKKLFGWREKEREKENVNRNWGEKVKPAEVEKEAEAQETPAEIETGENPLVKAEQKDLSPKKVLDTVKALVESAQLEDEKTWADIKEMSEKAMEAVAALESALQTALDASRRARSALEGLAARVGDRIA